MKIASVIITYSHVQDAKIQMDLIRNLWSEENELRNIDIYHSYNGTKKKYNKKYVENFLLPCSNPGLYEGAALLINTAISEIYKQKKKYDFIIVSSADVWLIKPKNICKLLNKMKANNYHLSTSLWFIHNQYATEFFIITPQLAKDVFPLSLDYYLTHNLVVRMFYKLKMFKLSVLEIYFAARIKEIINKKRSIFKSIKDTVYLIPGRKYIHPLNQRYSPKIGYYSQHDIHRKISLIGKEFIKKYSPTAKALIN